MHPIIGLGNPGSEYENTRHNIGFMVLDEFARMHAGKFRAGKGEFYAARADIGEAEIVLTKPTTYMNDSGIAVAQAMELFGVDLNRLLIVYDDFNIPLGTLRIRPGGTDGGHNGLASIIYQLQTEEIARLRCGIGTEAMPRDRVDFVLSPFEQNEQEKVSQMIGSACKAISAIVTGGTAAAMNTFNNSSE